MLTEISSNWKYYDISFHTIGFLVVEMSILFGLISLMRVGYKKIYNKIKNPFYYLIISAATALTCSTLWFYGRAVPLELIFNSQELWFSPQYDFTKLKVILMGAWVPFVWSVLYFGIKYWQELNTERQRTQNAIAMAQKAQLKMLQYQLNPHFLFNSLNSIQALIYENPDQADTMVTELSEFLRYSLYYNDRIIITVEEEIDITAKYLTIEKIRYEERLDSLIEIDDQAMNFEVPCFITQPLVENSIKHGLTNNPDGITIQLKVKIKNDQLTIQVSNTGSLATDWQPGVGLNNVIERLKNGYSKQAAFKLYESDGLVIAEIQISLNNEKISRSDN